MNANTKSSASTLKLSELIAAYGDDKIRFQNLDHCLMSAQMSKGKTVIMFGTDAPMSFDGLAQLGVIVWMDRNRVAEIIAASKEPAK